MAKKYETAIELAERLGIAWMFFLPAYRNTLDALILDERLSNLTGKPPLRKKAKTMSTKPATTDNRKFIHSSFEIERALANDYVFCHINILAPGKRFVVRDVKKKNGTAHVLVLEGWYKPDEVFTEDETR